MSGSMQVGYEYEPPALMSSSGREIMGNWDKQLEQMRELSIPHMQVEEAVFAGEKNVVIGNLKMSWTIPAHIRVQLWSMPEEGSRIHICVWLPLGHWNEELYAIGNGGYAGSYPTDPQSAPLKMGFAIATTDLGTSAGPDCGVDFPGVVKDFGYRANHEMTVAAREVIHAFYGKYPKHSYFMGGSTGGQQGLALAQRYPEDYDGIVICAPAWDRVNLHIAFVWDWVHLNRNGVKPFTKEDAGRISAAFLDGGALEGERQAGENFLRRPDRIRNTKSVLQRCGLSADQVEALEAVYAGPTDPVTGERIYEGSVVPGSESQDLGLTARCDGETFSHEFFYLFRWIFGTDFDFMRFDFHRDTIRLREALSGELDASEPDLSAFRERGGKLLMVHGTADPIIPMGSSIRYWNKVQETMGDTSDFFRLFLMPGMAHVLGGPGAGDFVYGMPGTPKDARHYGLCAVQEWVEKGSAPDALYPVCFRDEPASMLRLDGVCGEIKAVPYGGTKL